MKAQQETAKFGLPRVETDRFFLRAFEARDLDAAVRLFGDDEVQKYLVPENKRTVERMKITFRNVVRRWRERGFGLWCVAEKSADKMCGYCGFQYFDETPDVEIVFAFFKDCWGKGVASEAAKASLRFGFEELRFERVFAATHPENAASRRVLEKIGMTFEKRNTHYGIETISYVIACRDFRRSEGVYKLTYDDSDAAAIQ